MWRCCTRTTTPMCGIGKRIATLNVGIDGSNKLHAMCIAVRFVQFQQTSETNIGFNSKKRELATKWVTKSTKDYVNEAASSRTITASPTRDRLKAGFDENKKFVEDIQDNADRMFELEVNRLQDFKGRRYRKSMDMLKRQGVTFCVMYVAAYVGCLTLMYLAFSTGYVKKDAAYGVAVSLLNGMVEPDEFYRRVEAWDTYVDFGCAFVLNEAIEIVRFPFMLFTFYTFRPFFVRIGRRTKKSMFRRTAAEY